MNLSFKNVLCVCCLLLSGSVYAQVPQDLIDKAKAAGMSDTQIQQELAKRMKQEGGSVGSQATATDAKIRKAFATEIPGTTKIIIAQRISSIQDADRIIVMDNGRIDAFASHEELLRTNNIYKEVYEAQTQTGGGDFDENGGEL